MSKGRIYSNLDVNLTDAERAKIEKEEYETFLVDQQIQNTEEYKHHGMLNPRNATITKTQENWDAADVRKRRAEGKPVLPVWTIETEDGNVVNILSDADREAVMQGYVCENCLGWQESNIDINCKTIRGFSCGYKRSL